ncbi:uncharacterized protein METZ01_LOCUS211813, partial [marine metagenome]
MAKRLTFPVVYLSRLGILQALHIKTKMNDIAILNQVILAFQSPFASLFSPGFTLATDIIVIADHFCANE